MNVKAIKVDNEKAIFLAKGIDTELANAFRRTIINAVPVIAIDEVIIYDNSSVLFDEFLSHRLGLLSLKANPDKISDAKKPVLSLEKEGPCMVYASDIKSHDSKIEINDPETPLVLLKENQKIKAEMTVKVGTGKEHSKFIPATVGYHEICDVTSNDNCNQCGICVKVCPKNVLELKGKKIILKDELGCILCGECRDKCKKNAINIEYKSNDIVFFIESHGFLSPEEICLNSIKQLKEKANALKKEIKELK